MAGIGTGAPGRGTYVAYNPPGSITSSGGATHSPRTGLAVVPTPQALVVASAATGVFSDAAKAKFKKEPAVGVMVFPPPVVSPVGSGSW